MKHLMLMGGAVCALAVMPTLPAAAAMLLAPLTPAVTHADSDTNFVRYGGYAHHYGWGLGRGHYYNWSRGYHRRWR
jgi:hypothetical protein